MLCIGFVLVVLGSNWKSLRNVVCLFVFFRFLYEDGCWYCICVVYMFVNVILIVNFVGFLEVFDGCYVDIGEIVMDSGYVIIFGVFILNRLVVCFEIKIIIGIF